MEWKWVSAETVREMHERAVDEHGGLHGVRDEEAIESALARPRNTAAYEEPDAAELAAIYAHGIVKNHGFLDGNKRTAWATILMFLKKNDWKIEAPVNEAVETMERVARDETGIRELAQWLRTHMHETTRTTPARENSASLPESPR